MLTPNRTRINQAVEVIEGQLTCIKEIINLGEGETTDVPPTIQPMIDQSMTIIVMAVKSLTQP